MRFVFLILFISFFCAEVRAQSVFQDYYDQMDYLTQRDMIISQNLANADTPGYKPKELKKKGSGDSSVSLKTTNPMHFGVDESASGYEVSDAEILELKPNGNAVTLENELYKKSENSMRLQEATNMYNKSRGMLKTAILGNK